MAVIQCDAVITLSMTFFDGYFQFDFNMSRNQFLFDHCDNDSVGLCMADIVKRITQSSIKTVVNGFDCKSEIFYTSMTAIDLNLPSLNEFI